MMTDLNFEMTPYQPSNERAQGKYRGTAKAARKEAARPTIKAPASSKNEAARTGDMTAAINEGE